MSVAAPPSSSELLSALRGTPALRPLADRGLAGGLRAWIEDGIFERIGAPRPGEVRLTSRTVTDAPVASSATALLRGALIAQLVCLTVGSFGAPDPFDDAACALRASGRNDDLVTLLDGLDEEEVARLAAEVDAHYAVLHERLPSLPSRWSPRFAVRQAVPLAGGGVELRGLVDVALGRPGGAQACVCLLEVTTSVLGPRHDALLAYLALLETLRAGEAPLRVAALSTADGASVVRDVTPELLADGVERVLAALVPKQPA